MVSDELTEKLDGIADFERATQLLFNEIYLGYVYLFKRNI